MESDLKILLFCLVFMSFTFSAFAWGPTGHRVVGEIAEKRLNFRVKKKLNSLLDGHSLARVSNWPDKIKSEPEKYSHTFRWHYTDWPLSSQQYDFENNSGSLISSINKMIEQMKNKKLPKGDRAFAIKFLVHLIGDLHQPLHVGNGKDRGGNDCKVIFHDEKVNLHSLWDSKMILATRLSFKELTEFVEVASKKEIKKYENGEVLDWARESRDLRPSLYPEDLNSLKQKKNSEDTLPSYCQKGKSLTDEELPKLGYKYSYRFLPIVEKRLLQAGVRLAKVLNENL